MNEAKGILKTVFGYDGFRPLQEVCIRSVLAKKDTLLIMPTGGGKSLCYQIPALIFKGLTVVVSPLISLMKDQVRQLHAVGVDAALLNSSLDEEEYELNREMVRSGRARLLFLAPETLLRPDILTLLEGARVECFVIDEAHCISDWGHDFRPEYRQLSKVRGRFSQAVCLAMTATATPRVRKDIRESLGIGEAQELIASFNRPNLFYEVIPKSEPFKQTVDFLKRFPDQSGIIYCFSRKQVDSVAADLEEKGFSVKPYHAGLTPEARSRNQESFIRDDVQIMVATIAFGMGINKPNVRFVLHYDLPKNIESYYQETGRAGRDGLPAHCLLLFGYGDIHNIRFLIDQKGSDQEKQVAGMHLNSMIRYAEAELCRRVPLITYFGENFQAAACGHCDNCHSPKEATFDLAVSALKFFGCMRETGERFGAGHLIDVLRGSESQKVEKFSHDRLESYGAGKQYTAKQWHSLIRQFLQKDLIWQDQEAFGALKLTVAGRGVLKGANDPILGFPPAEEIIKAKIVKLKPQTADYDEDLFQILRKKRKSLADELGVPPYVVFSDKSLIDMCAQKPTTPQRFSQIYGVGAKKLELYAETFTKIIKEHTVIKEKGGDFSLRSK